MKKLLTMVAVLATACVMFLGCPQEATTDEGPAPAFTITYKDSAQWAAPTFTVKDDWKTLEVEFDKEYADIQFCVISDAVEAEQSWGTSYFSIYPKAEVKTTLDIAAQLEIANDSGKTLKDNGATKVEKISIQNKTASGFKVKVMSAKVTKADGSVENVTPAGDWGSEVK